jgi:hypothetical protein
MKRIVLSLLAISLMIFMLSSCASMKRDCQGNKHYKLKNGIYL